jgi:TIR domain
MPVKQSELLAAARASTKTITLTEALAHHIRTAFLCHSHLDRDLATGLVKAFAQQQIDVYVDWADQSMPEKPNRTTAEKIQKKIRSCDRFLFLATANSMRSRWCPWEIGFADGVKPITSILIIPTQDSTGSHGNEYLELYRRLDGPVGALKLYEAASAQGQTIHAL